MIARKLVILFTWSLHSKLGFYFFEMSSFSEEISSNDEMGSDEEIDSEEFGSDTEIKSSEEFIGSDDEDNYSEDGSRYESSMFYHHTTVIWLYYP